MKTIKFIIIVVVSFVIFTMTANAQSSGTNQIGVRLGGFSGIDFRHVSNSDVVIHLNIAEYYPFGRVMMEGMIEKNFPIQKGNGFVFYIGGGGFVATDYRHVYNTDAPHFRYTVYYLAPIPGLTATAGLDYYIPKAPFVIGVDVRPRFSFYGLYPWDGGLSFRYIF